MLDIFQFYSPLHCHFFTLQLLIRGLFFHANDYLFSDGGDGIKNYYTYAGHARESTVVESRLMNYPYGESFLYLDCHPLFTVLSQKISNLFPRILDYSVGTINFAMLFSIVLSALFLYLIFIELQVNRWYAALSAFAIAVLAPQVFRFSGHFALSYSVFIPLTWYLLIRYIKTSSLRLSIFIALNNLLWFFVHAYLGMIAVSFVAFNFAFIVLIRLRKQKKLLSLLVNFCLQTIVPVILFYAFAKATDTHIGRTDNPYGFLVYTSSPESVFFPSLPPLRPLFDHFFTIEQTWEGLAYIGLASIITLSVFALRLLRNLGRLAQLKSKKVSLEQGIVASAILSGLLLLLLSFGLPFKLDMEFSLEEFPLIKNFRGIGRFRLGVLLHRNSFYDLVCFSFSF